MTIFCGPQDGGGAGTMSQAQWEEVESKLWSDGVIPGARNTFTVTTTTGLGISVNTGDAIVDGFRFYADATTPLTAATADPSLPRIDLVVLRIDEAAHTATIALKTGTPAASPSAPTATKTVGGTYELGIYQVRVNAGATSITSLTDVRTYTTAAGAVNKTGDTMTGALIVSQTLGGANKVFGIFNASDGKQYQLIITTAGKFVVWNNTDSANVAEFGPGLGQITANGNTVWTAANDGSGSGLDADTLDGHQPGSGNGLDADTVDGVQAASMAQAGSHNAIVPIKLSAGTVLPASLDANEIFFLLA